jgi:hypothetical protein
MRSDRVHRSGGPAGVGDHASQHDVRRRGDGGLYVFSDRFLIRHDQQSNAAPGHSASFGPNEVQHFDSVGGARDVTPDPMKDDSPDLPGNYRGGHGEFGTAGERSHD